MTDIVYAGFSLLLVLGLIMALAWAAKRLQLTPVRLPKKSKKNILVQEIAPIDHKNRLIEVSWRGTTYLLASGENGIRKITQLSSTHQTADPFSSDKIQTLPSSINNSTLAE